MEQDGAAVRFNLDSTDAGMAEKDSAEDSASCPGEQVHFSHGSKK